ncbi:MAG: LysM peptidoglycan-binding domain-containing protein [Litorilinea sp.]
MIALQPVGTGADAQVDAPAVARAQPLHTRGDGTDLQGADLPRARAKIDYRTKVGIAPLWARTRRTFLLVVGIMLTAFFILIMNVQSVRAADAIHVVHPGDSLAAIALANNLSLQELSEYNGIANANHIVIGQQIRIPASTSAILNAPATDRDQLPGGDGYYVIQQGNSLSQIAQSFGIDQADLMRLNGLNNADRIFVGQTVRVTARVPAPPEARDQRPQLADAIHVVKAGDTLASIAQTHNTTLTDLLTRNGLPNANFVYVGQRLRLTTPTSAETAFNVAGAPQDGIRRIEIDLTRQTLTAYQGDVVVMHTTVSTGKAETPTVTGTFAVGTKYDSQRMYGDGYDLPGVPWVMYFFEDYAIHGAYWHMNWGTPMSRGCVNMNPEEARMLYQWAAPGTEVTVRY